MPKSPLHQSDFEMRPVLQTVLLACKLDDPLVLDNGIRFG
jgi:hypothetical protein